MKRTFLYSTILILLFGFNTFAQQDGQRRNRGGQRQNPNNPNPSGQQQPNPSSNRGGQRPNPNNPNPVQEQNPGGQQQQPNPGSHRGGQRPNPNNPNPGQGQNPGGQSPPQNNPNPGKGKNPGGQRPPQNKDGGKQPGQNPGDQQRPPPQNNGPFNPPPNRGNRPPIPNTGNRPVPPLKQGYYRPGNPGWQPPQSNHRPVYNPGWYGGPPQGRPPVYGQIWYNREWCTPPRLRYAFNTIAWASLAGVLTYYKYDVPPNYGWACVASRYGEVVGIGHGFNAVEAQQVAILNCDNGGYNCSYDYYDMDCSPR